jgi:LysM repeat protein
MSTYAATAVWAPATQVSAHVVRLTRRGRVARSMALAAVILLLAISVADVVGGGRARASSADVVVPMSTLSVVVEPGDSLWTIAEQAAPTTDPREVVSRIRDLNGLRSNLIQPGQVLLVPSGL